MEKHEKLSPEPGKWRQFLVAMVVNLSMVTYGLIIGWQSPYGPQLQSSSPPVGSEPMSDEGVSWLSGILCLSGVLTTVLLSIIPDRFSRKLFGYLVTLPLAASWVLIIFATEHTHIYIARFLCGVAGASLFYFVPVYISEISNDSIRGLLGSVLVFTINIGILIAYILGGMLSMRTFSIVSLAVVASYVVTFSFMPESPVYLVRQNRIRDAVRSLTWLKAGDNLAAERTLSYLQAEMKEADKTARSVKLTDLFRDRATIKGLVIIVGLFVGQQFCGIFAMLSYTETIFAMSGSSLSPNTSAIIVGAIQFLGSIMASSLMEHAGRRILLLVSCAGMFLCHCVIGTFCYFQEFGYDVSAFDWVPVVALSIFILVYALGMSGGPIIVTSEIFSRDVASLAATIGLTSLWITAFIMVMIFSQLIALLGMYGCFFTLAISCALSFIFCFVLLPETKGRMREDIVDELNGKQRTINESGAKYIIGTHSTQGVHV